MRCSRRSACVSMSAQERAGAKREWSSGTTAWAMREGREEEREEGVEEDEADEEPDCRVEGMGERGRRENAMIKDE